MSKQAIIVTRDHGGLAALCRRLAEDFGYALRAGEQAGHALLAESVPFEPISEADAAGLIVSAGPELQLVVANFRSVEESGRSFLSWKSALASFDRCVVDAVRAAAWRADVMTVVCQVSEYAMLCDRLAADGGRLKSAFRVEQARAALAATSAFDASLSRYLEIHGAEAPDLGALGGFPKTIQMVARRAARLASGENRHQQSALYGSFSENFNLLCGSPLDYEAILNISRSAYIMGEYEQSASALVARGRVLWAGFDSGSHEVDQGIAKAVEASPSGLWLASNAPLVDASWQVWADKGVTGWLVPNADGIEIEAIRARGGLRVVSVGEGLGYDALQEWRSVAGGFLVQDKDRWPVNPMEWKPQGLAQPSMDDWEPMILGVKLVRHLDSSSCALMRGARLAGLTAGSVSADQAWARLRRNCDDFRDTVLIFDEPVREERTLIEAKELGVRTVLHPGGGANDDGLRDAANGCGMALLATGRALTRL